MAVEVASAYVTLMPSMKGFQKRMEKEFRGMNLGTSAGDKAGDKFGGGFTKKATSSLSKWAKRGLVAAGAAAGAALGTAIVGGMNRMLNIEDAENKLLGLGHSAENVTKIMDDALKSVKGTAFGLDEAATNAATAVAAGVKPGEELTRYLTLVGDAATIAGVGLGEMGSIFGKVQTNQRAYTQELNQLADRGIPIYQWLQKEYGVTAEELRKMVSDGQVDAETYFKVIDENIGGAALNAGNTTRGALANMRAAWSRFGAALLKDIFPLFKDGIKWATDWADSLTDKVGPAVEWVSDAFTGLRDLLVNGDFTEAFRNAFGVEEDAWIVGFLQNVHEGAEGLVKLFQREGTGQLANWLGVEQSHPIIEFLQNVRDFVTVTIPDGIQTLKDIVEGVFNVITRQGTGKLAEALGVDQDHWAIVGLRETRDFIEGMVRWVIDTAIPGVADFFGGFKDGFVDFTSGVDITGTLKLTFEALWDALQVGWRIIKNHLIPVVMDLWDMWNEYVLPVLKEVWAFVVEKLWPDLVKAFQNHIVPAVQAVAEKFTEFWEGAAKPALEALWKFIRDTLWPFIEDFYENGIKPTFTLIGDTIEWVWTKVISPSLSALIDMIGDTVDAFEGAKRGIERAWDKVRQIVAKPIVAVIQFVNDGIIGPLNTVLEWADVKTIDEIPVPKSLYNAAMGYGANSYSGSAGRSGSGTLRGMAATGAVLPGYSPGHDNMRFYSPDGSVLALSGGEAVMRPEWTRAVGKDFVDRMNYAARTGGANAVRAQMAFANGGVIEDKGGGVFPKWLTNLVSWPLNKAKDILGRMFGDHLENLRSNPFFAVGESFVKKILKAVTEKARSLFSNDGGGTQYANYGGAYGWAPTGLPWQAIWSLIKMAAPEAIMTSNYRPGAITASGVPSLHGQGRAVDIWSPNMPNTFMKIRGLLKWSQLFHTPMGDLQYGYRDAIVARTHHDHIHAAFAKGGLIPKLYDEGGWLQPGVSLVANKTQKPEAILTEEQLNNIGGDTHITLYGVPMDVASETADELLFAMRRTGRGKYNRAR